MAEQFGRAKFGTIEDGRAALARMDRARNRGTGCYLTREMVGGLGITLIGEYMGEATEALRSRPVTDPTDGGGNAG